MPAKKDQKFIRYTPELKKEAVRLRLEEGISESKIIEALGIRSETQVRAWVEKYQNGESFDDLRGKTAWRKGRPKTTFLSLEEELAYVKAEVAYLKKRYPNLHGKE